MEVTSKTRQMRGELQDKTGNNQTQTKNVFSNTFCWADFVAQERVIRRAVQLQSGAASECLHACRRVWPVYSVSGVQSRASRGLVSSDAPVDTDIQLDYSPTDQRHKGPEVIMCQCVVTACFCFCWVAEASVTTGATFISLKKFHREKCSLFSGNVFFSLADETFSPGSRPARPHLIRWPLSSLGSQGLAQWPPQRG